MKDPVNIGDLVAKAVDPVLKRRAGMSAGLTAGWSGIVGEELAAHSQPLKIKWPKRAREADDAFEPATLVIAASGMWALRIQHQTGEIIGRVNAFFGYHAIARIAIEQKSFADAAKKPAQNAPPKLSADAVKRLEEMTSDIDDEDLRRSVKALGARIIAERKK